MRKLGLVVAAAVMVSLSLAGTAQASPKPSCIAAVTTSIQPLATC